MYYTAEIIAEIVSIYKSTNYNHTKTIKLFREKHKNSTHFKLCHDTLKLIIKSEQLPWYNERDKKTIVYANTVKEVAKNGTTKAHFAVVTNTTDVKYKAVCDSQAQADALVNIIWKRFESEQEPAFRAYLATCTKVEKDWSGATRIKWMINQDIYDKYLDLSQYDLSKIKSTKSNLGGELERTIDTKIVKGRGSLCSIVYGVKQ